MACYLAYFIELKLKKSRITINKKGLRFFLRKGGLKKQGLGTRTVRCL